MDREPLANGHAIEVSLVHIEGALSLIARDREPGVWSSATRHRPSRCLDASAFELLCDLADEVCLAIKG